MWLIKEQAASDKGLNIRFWKAPPSYLYLSSLFQVSLNKKKQNIDIEQKRNIDNVCVMNMKE